MPALGQLSPGGPYIYLPLGFQELTSMSSAKTLTVPGGAQFAVFCAMTDAVLFRDDGTAPTSSVGINLAVGVPYWYYGGQAGLTACQFIQSTSGAILNCSFYK